MSGAGEPQAAGRGGGARSRRREERRLALIVQFSAECTGYSLAQTLELLPGFKAEWAAMPEFTLRLCRTVEEHRREISDELQAVLEHWKMERVGVAERAILRLGCVEILHFPDIPPRVTINEYLELAKLYADDNAPAFVNGILDKIVQRCGKPDVVLVKSARSRRK